MTLSQAIEAIRQTFPNIGNITIAHEIVNLSKPRQLERESYTVFADHVRIATHDNLAQLVRNAADSIEMRMLDREVSA